jgi:hypothetical protein
MPEKLIGLLPSVREVQTATRPMLNEILKMFISEGEPFAERLEIIMEKLYMAGYNNGYITKTIETICSKKTK